SHVINEVHIYTSDTTSFQGKSSISIPLDRIYKIETFKIDAAATKASKTTGTVALVAILVVGTVTIITAAVVASSLNNLGGSSCPYVSTYDGAQYTLQGELFGGSINHKLKRKDFLPLDIQPVNGEYQLKLSNELQERQYIDYANLILVEHNSKDHVGFGADGQPYTINQPIAPETALLNYHRDVLEAINQKDKQTCRFNDTLSSTGLNELILSFSGCSGADRGKLVLNLKNDFWLENVMGLYFSHFGSRYPQWARRLNKQPAERLVFWASDQQIPLSISIHTHSGWKEIMKLYTVGPLMNREVVVPIELPNTDVDPVLIKLSCGFMFWDLDYVAMDFTPDEHMNITSIQPYSAIDENGTDVLATLTGNDDRYYSQFNTG
ncbi:MAG TPA: hypothetical protein VJ508_06220, partial [Saprospiraceae bacterium]|nr:hypothetical protein [Saprospiraceae bacterium]